MGTRMLSDTGHRGVCIQSMGNFDDDISKGLEEKTVSGIILARASTGYICRKVLILKGEKLMEFSDITVKQERRLCVVNGRMGYFHCWEHYSRPVEPSPMIGGAPGGVISFVRAIVEFPEGIGYVDPKDLKFCDEENVYLHRLLKIEDMRKEKKKCSNGH